MEKIVEWKSPAKCEKINGKVEKPIRLSVFALSTFPLILHSHTHCYIPYLITLMGMSHSS